MLNLAVPIWELVLRSVVVYGFLLVLLRLTGKRQVGQLAPFISVATYRSRRLDALIEGRPQVIVHNGKLYDRVLKDAKLTRHELHAALRQAGCESVEQVHTAVLENNGSISVVQRK